MSTLTRDQLAAIMPRLAAAKLDLYFPYLTAAMDEFGITTTLRMAAFLAQVAHESDQLLYMEEIASGAAYEGRADLGNTQPGDGVRFKGRGPIQLTGRANYQAYGQALGVDLINDPQRAADPDVGFRTAGLYWQLHQCNGLADLQAFSEITRKINGGLNGEADREAYYAAAKRVLAPPMPATATQADSLASESGNSNPVPAPISPNTRQAPPSVPPSAASAVGVAPAGDGLAGLISSLLTFFGKLFGRPA